ncbi:MAG: thiamine ABC transporter permease [Clostridia bacterium]|nr:MAG: thiamine ABC transporter permease [Clostridia bacterium]
MTTKDYQQKGMFSIFLSFFKPHRGLFFLDMVCALFVALVDLAYPVISRKAINTLLPNLQYKTFFIVMGIVVLAYVVRSLLYYVITYWGHTFGIRVEADIREALFTHMQTLGFDFYDRNRTGHLMSRLTTDLFEITELAHHGPEDLFIAIVTITGALIVMFTIEWRLALVVCVLIPVAVFVIMSRRRAMGRASRLVKQKVGVINADIESCLSGMRTAKAFANEAVEAEKFRRSNETYKGSKKYFYQEMGIFNSSMEFFVSILSVAVVTVGGALIMQGRMDVVDLLTFTLYITTFVNPIRKLANFAEMFANGTAGLERFVEIMRTEPALDDAPDAKELSKVNGAIDVDHVSFAYEGELDVLHDVSLHVNPGETIAVVGPSGGGKSTLCQLIPRFYDVTGGSIRVDGQDVRAVTQQSLRRAIGVVQQDVFLFADSILENIRYGRPDASMDEIIAAAKRAEIYDDIMAMPDGFDTYVGERGTLLSGGQKQRISIARVFLKDPSILILDEATSALDSMTEAKIQHAFDELAKNRTTLIIAHRLSTIRAASRIVVIVDGKIAEQGTHAELTALNGTYAALCRTQNLLQ